jgi:hypothetical protein
LQKTATVFQRLLKLVGYMALLGCISFRRDAVGVARTIPEWRNSRTGWQNQREVKNIFDKFLASVPCRL